MKKKFKKFKYKSYIDTYLEKSDVQIRDFLFIVFLG